MTFTRLQIVVGMRLLADRVRDFAAAAWRALR